MVLCTRFPQYLLKEIAQEEMRQISRWLLKLDKYLSKTLSEWFERMSGPFQTVRKWNWQIERGWELRTWEFFLAFHFSRSRLIKLSMCQSFTHLSRHCDGKTKSFLQNTSEYERGSNVRPTAIVCVREKWMKESRKCYKSKAQRFLRKKKTK